MRRAGKSRKSSGHQGAVGAQTRTSGCDGGSAGVCWKRGGGSGCMHYAVEPGVCSRQRNGAQAAVMTIVRARSGDVVVVRAACSARYDLASADNNKSASGAR